MKPLKHLTSRVAPLPLENVDTDQIIPASYLKVTDKSGLGEGLFARWRYDAGGAPRPDFFLNDSRYQDARILLAGENFGCGSSREHAPWALLDHGFKAVLSPRFADIFRSNALKNGLLVVDLSPAAYRDLLRDVEGDPELRLTVDLESQEITSPGRATLAFTMDPFARYCLLNGVDQLGFLLSQIPEVEAYEERAPARVDTRRKAS